VQKRARNKEPPEEEDRVGNSIPVNCPKRFKMMSMVCVECCFKHSRATIGVEDEVKRNGSKCPILENKGKD